MTEHERYPETGVDTGPLDGLVAFLRDVDASHQEKAIALLAAARTEHGYAVEDGEADPADFGEWSVGMLDVLDDILDGYARGGTVKYHDRDTPSHE